MDSTFLINENRRESLGSGVMGTFTAQVFGWMTLGLLITTAVGFLLNLLINNNLAFAQIVLTITPIVFIIELIVVVALSALGTRMNGFLALGLFLFYSALNGFLIGLIMFSYEVSSLILAFGITGGAFLLLAGYGIVTRTDLTRWGSIALFGLLGLVLATLVNIIISIFNPALSGGIYWITNYLGVGIFSILVAYDAQKIKMLAMEAERNQDGVLKYSIMGALTLYLDFINLFIRILAITGKRRK